MIIFKPFVKFIDKDDYNVFKKGDCPSLGDFYKWGSVDLFSTKEKAKKSLKKILNYYKDYEILQIGISEEHVDNSKISLYYTTKLLIHSRANSY